MKLFLRKGDWGQVVILACSLVLLYCEGTIGVNPSQVIFQEIKNENPTARAGKSFEILPPPVFKNRKSKSTSTSTQGGTKVVYPTPDYTMRTWTTDGYALDSWVIKPVTGSNTWSAGDKYPVLILHGLTCNSDFMLGAENHLAGAMANEGHSVVLGNLRGSAYGCTSQTSNDQNDNFWNLGLESSSCEDVQALMTATMKATRAPKLILVTHGTSAAGALITLSHCNTASMQKVDQMVFLAPVVFTNNVGTKVFDSMATKGGSFCDWDCTANTNFPRNRVVLSRQWLIDNNEKSCQTYDDDCVQFPFGVLSNFDSTCTSRLDPFGKDIIKQAGDVAPKYVLMQMAQHKYNERFCRYDFGFFGNYGTYRQSSPPDYPLNKVTIPTTIYSVSGDRLSTVRDCEILNKKLPNSQMVYMDPSIRTQYELLSSNNATALDYCNDHILSTIRRKTTATASAVSSLSDRASSDS